MFRARLLLWFAAFFWGTAFVAQKEAAHHISACTFTALRFALGALLLTPWALVALLRWRRAAGWQDREPRLWLLLFLLGGLLFAGVVTQQLGVERTAVTHAGILSALYIPLVPLLGWVVWGKRPSGMELLLTFVAYGGVLLFAEGSFEGLYPGDYWIVVSTFFWALHIQLLARILARCPYPALIAATQFALCALLALGCALIFESSDALQQQMLFAALPAIIYAGVFSVAFGFSAQVFAQSRLAPTEAAIIMSLEVPIAALAGMIIYGDTLTLSKMVGALLIFASVLSAALLEREERSGR